MLAKIRKAIKLDPLADQLSGHIEVDETYFGGRRKGKRGRGAAGKIPVIGLIQRNGSVRTIAIPNVKSSTLSSKSMLKPVARCIPIAGTATEALIIAAFLINWSIMTKYLYLAKGIILTRLKATGDYQSTSFTQDTIRSLRDNRLIIWHRRSSNLMNELIQTL